MGNPICIHIQFQGLFLKKGVSSLLTKRAMMSDLKGAKLKQKETSSRLDNLEIVNQVIQRINFEEGILILME